MRSRSLRPAGWRPATVRRKVRKGARIDEKPAATAPRLGRCVLVFSVLLALSVVVIAPYSRPNELIRPPPPPPREAVPAALTPPRYSGALRLLSRGALDYVSIPARGTPQSNMHDFNPSTDARGVILYHSPAWGSSRFHHLITSSACSTPVPSYARRHSVRSTMRRITTFLIGSPAENLHCSKPARSSFCISPGPAPAMRREGGEPPSRCVKPQTYLASPSHQPITETMPSRLEPGTIRTIMLIRRERPHGYHAAAEYAAARLPGRTSAPAPVVIAADELMPFEALLRVKVSKGFL